MDIRAAQKHDIRPLAELWAHAFPGERTVDQRIRQLEAGGVYGGIETAWIANDGGLTAGGFRAYRLRQHMHGALMPMMGLAAVAVAAHARRRGLGGDLCRMALRHARDRGDLLSVLYPFRPSFYEALGWGLAGAMHSHWFRPESLPVTHPKPAVFLLSDAAAKIGGCYDRVAPTTNGLIARSGRIWRQHLDWPDVHTFGLMRGDECAAYAIVHYGSQTLADEKLLTIRELVAIDDNAYDEMLSWVSLQRDLWRFVHYDALPSERLDLRLTEPRTPGVAPVRVLFAQVARVIRGPMLRVLSVGRALEARRDWERERVQGVGFTLRVRDRELPENCGPFNVRVRGGRAEVSEGEGMGTTLDVSASVFAQIFAGELSVSEALRLGRAKGEGDVAMLDELFRARSEFVLLDEF